jgi:predicted lipoprotein with Yx(FWY)xxD motif
MNIKYLTSAGLAVVIALIAVIVLAVGGGTAKTRPSQTAASGSAVAIRSTSLGKTLVDANGRTLYLFEGDKANVSRLSRAGLAVWPRFTSTSRVKAENGAQAAKIGTITGPHGVRQVTYNGHPLYYYVGDSKPGSTRGQRLDEFGALWYVLGPNGNAVTTAASNSQSAPAAPAGGYGY